MKHLEMANDAIFCENNVKKKTSKSPIRSSTAILMPPTRKYDVPICISPSPYSRPRNSLQHLQ